CRYRVEAGSIGGELALSGEDFRALGPFLELALEGKGSVDGRFDGTVEEPRVEGRAELERIGLQGVSLGRVRGPFQIFPGGLQVAGLRAFDERATLDGRIALTRSQENDWKARLDGVPLEHLGRLARVFRPSLPPLSGDAHAEIAVAGPWIGLRFGSRLAVRNLGAGDQPLGNLEAEANGTAGAWTVRAVLEADEMQGRIDLGLSEGGSLSGTANFAGKDLKTIALLRARWPEISGEFGLDASLQGTAAQPEGEARVVFRNVQIAGRKIGDAVFQLSAEGERLSLDGGAGRLWHLRGTSTLRAPYPFEARAEWDDLELAPFLLPEARAEVRSSGKGRLEGTVSSPLGSGEVTITRLSIGREGVRITNPKAISLVIRQGVIELPEAVLEGRAERLVVRGRLGPQSEIVAEGTGSLALLETVVPGVASAQGRFRVQLRATRSEDQPWRYYGGGRIDDGALDLGFLLGITELAGEVEFDERRAEVRNLTGNLGGGGFLVEGAIGFDKGWELGWALRDANLGIPEWLDYRAAGNGRLVGRFDHPTLTGEIEITQAVYDRRIEWGEFLPWFRREAQRSTRDVSLPVDLELHVYADGGLFVDNNLAEAELQGSLDVRGGGTSVTWAGRMDVLSGEFSFRRRQFTITSGSVQFLERRPLNPDLEFRGETTVETGEADYEISVHVGGTAERPRIEFTADDPALSENDVLALVTFGRTVAQLQAQGAGIELAEVLALTAGPNAARVEERIYNVIPIDQIEIQPTFSRTTGTTEPRLSIGKDLTSALRALVSTGLGSERQQDVALEYELTPRISVQGIWESQTKSQAGAFGGDLKFRFPFRTFARFSLLPHGLEGEP
ncbi:MAG: translocation/assembly module TamB domain-containing protein, partial [Candidatus Binatia bacterium]